MEHNLRPTVIEEEQGGLAFQLLFDWYTNALQALVDSAGHEGAIEFLRPYNRNAGMAATLIVKEVFHLRSGDRIAWSFLIAAMTNFMARAPVMEATIYEEGGVARVTDCPFKYGPIEHCALLCDFGPNITAETFGIASSTRRISSLSQGDRECRWITEIGIDNYSRNEDQLGIEIANVLKWQFPRKMVDSFSIQYFAEWWIIATRSLIDHIGERQVIVILKPYMKHSGISFGLRGSSISTTDDNSLERIFSVVEQCGSALQMKVTASPSNGAMVERTIIECPFKDAPVQVCQQFEAFCNGICEAIDPDYEFVYDRMMTKGDKSCHWMIRKRGKASSAGSDATPSSEKEDMLRSLKWRLIKGEISKEEYEELRNLVQE